MYNYKKIGVIGAGSFGTALATVLAGKGNHVTLWARKTQQIEEMRRTGENSHYLPGVKLPSEIELSDDLKNTCEDKDYLLFAVPAQSFRDVLTEAAK